RQSLAYLLDRTERGQMPADFFTTDAMKAYLGAVNHERGHAFAESVAEALRRDGWQARTSVKMRELSAPIEYGDLDVLAWTNTATKDLAFEYASLAEAWFEAVGAGQHLGQQRVVGHRRRHRARVTERQLIRKMPVEATALTARCRATGGPGRAGLRQNGRWGPRR